MVLRLLTEAIIKSVNGFIDYQYKATIQMQNIFHLMKEGSAYGRERTY